MTDGDGEEEEEDQDEDRREVDAGSEQSRREMVKLGIAEDNTGCAGLINTKEVSKNCECSVFLTSTFFET